MKVKDCDACIGCPQRELRPDNELIPPLMGPSLRLIVDEFPGEDEERVHEPLVGSRGRIFMGLARKAGVSRAEVSIVNVISCRPVGDVYPKDHKITEHCVAHHLKPVLDARPWTRIDAIDEHSLRVLTGKVEGIMKWRGSPLPLSGETRPRVIGVLDPLYLMKDSGMIPSFVSDLAKSVRVPEQHYNLQPTMEELDAFHPDILYTDIETNRWTGEITMVGIADRPYHVMVMPFRGPYIGQLKRIFLEAKQIVNQNIIAFDLPHLATAGVVVRPDCKIWDIMLLHHLVEPNAPHDLEYIASL